MTSAPPEPAEPGTPENLGLKKPDTPKRQDAEDIEEKGEPFDGNFA